MPGFVPYKNVLRLTRIARDKVCQLPAQGRWFFPGTPASYTSKTDRRDITEILLKVALNPNQTNINPNAIKQLPLDMYCINWGTAIRKSLS